jgi:Asp/Glu/Hydantoin racemase
MRLLLINPNLSEGVSALIEAEARRSADPGTALTVLTAPFGVVYIETRFEALIGAYATAQLAAEHHAGHDAVIVAAFGDPGIAGLRATAAQAESRPARGAGAAAGGRRRPQTPLNSWQPQAVNLNGRCRCGPGSSSLKAKGTTSRKGLASGPPSVG